MLFRPAAETDVPQITDLLISVFPRHARTGGFWRWSCDTQPGVTFVAEDRGRIVGHHSFRYQRFCYGNQDLVGAFGQQTAMHRDYRNLVNAIELYKQAEQEAAQHCDFSYGFPNEKMVRLEERVFGSSIILRFQASELPADVFSANVDGLACSSDPGLAVQRLHTFIGAGIPATDGLADDVLRMVRDESWLEWRYVRNPVAHCPIFGVCSDGQYVGFAVLKMYLQGDETIGHIIELTAWRDCEPAQMALLKAASSFFEFARVSRVVVWNQHPDTAGLYDRLGFAPTGFWTSLVTKPFQGSPADTRLMQWAFDMGCSDVF